VNKSLNFISTEFTPEQKPQCWDALDYGSATDEDLLPAKIMVNYSFVEDEVDER